MKELSIKEVQAVSGAGQIEERLSAAYGSFFLRAVNVLNKLFDLGYDPAAAEQKGLEFGSQLGKAIEGKLAAIFDTLKGNVTGN